jgi:hypothetical protein
MREQLRRGGHRVLLPVLLPDLDLDWVQDPGPGPGGTTRRTRCAPPARGWAQPP